MLATVFKIAIVIGFVIFIASWAGLLDATRWAVFALVATVVSALAALTYSILWDREWRRLHPH